METTISAVTAPRDQLTDQAVSESEYEGLVKTHQRLVFRLLLGWTRDPELADTLTQDCFLRAYRALPHLRVAASAEAWLVSIALNLARDHRRNRRQGFWRRLLRPSQEPPGSIPEPADSGPSPERALLARERLARVRQALERLPRQQRAVAQLRFAQDLPLARIAELLGLEVGTVKSHLSRAVGALRRAAGPEEAS